MEPIGIPIQEYNTVAQKNKLENDLEIARISDKCPLGHKLHLSYDD
jgi:hypothetical protein